MNWRWIATLAMTLFIGGCGDGRAPAPVPFADDMVVVPAGPFEAGCDPGQEIAVLTGLNPNRHPCTPELHRVHPRRVIDLPAFEIDRLEVTVAAYLRCWYAGPCQEASPTGLEPPPIHWTNWWIRAARSNDPMLERLLRPMVSIRPKEARAYCEWAGKRLPTELEWEKAARGTDFRPYPWGTEPPTCDRAVYRLVGRDTPCPLRNYRFGLAAQPVGSRPKGASPYGALDMIGNVTEITEPAMGPATEGGAVLRGRFPDGDGVPDMQVFLRSPIEWNVSSMNIGFRCARSIAPAGP